MTETDKVTLTVRFDCVRPDQVAVLMALFKYWEYLGAIGSSRITRLYSDGDGSFRPKVSFHDANVPADALTVARNNALQPNGDWHADSEDCLNFYRDHLFARQAP